MTRKILAVIVLLLLTSSAFAESTLYSVHQSITSIKDGRSDFSDARFMAVTLAVHDEAKQTSDEYVNAQGIMTLSGGNYSWWSGQRMLSNAGTAHNFILLTNSMKRGGDHWVFGENVSDYPDYMPVNLPPYGEAHALATMHYVNFFYGADEGMKGVNVSWDFPGLSSLNGRGTVPNFRTTREQLNNFVPYIEILSDDAEGSISGIRWRIVDPSDTSAPKPQNFRLCVKSAIVNGWEVDSYYAEPMTYIEAGETPEGTINFEYTQAIRTRSTPLITLELVSYEDGTPINYEWNYIVQEEVPAEAGGILHAVTLPLRDGRPDYTRRYINDIGFSPSMGASFRINEAKYLTSEGRGTLPAGRYIMCAISESEIAKFTSASPINVTRIEDAENSFLVESESSITFPLLPMTRFGEGYLNFGSFLNLAAPDGGTLSGKTITYTFPDELNLNCSQVIPAYRSIDEQLASFVPYVDVVSADGMISAVNYRLVQLDDLQTPYNPGVSYDSTLVITGHNYGSRSVGIPIHEPQHGTYTLDEPVSVKDIESILFTANFYDENNTSIRYGWEFVNELASGFFSLPELNDDVLNNIVNTVDGISSAGEIRQITFDEIGELSITTEEVREYFDSEKAEGVGRFNTLNVESSGWYAMRVVMTDELFDALNGQSVENFRVYALTDSDSRDVNASFITGLLNTWEILSLSGERFDKFGVKEFLMVGFLNAGQPLSMYLGKILLALLMGGCESADFGIIWLSSAGRLLLFRPFFKKYLKA
ncbi:MAG: hypothetical protein IJS28_04445 [Synergistaceae bacterium]|nr:hypothetical protein [Synergistaceae bacterium]